MESERTAVGQASQSNLLSARLGELSTARQEEVIKRVIARMTALYGNKIDRLWGDNGERLLYNWRVELAEFQVGEIARGVEAMKYSAWPPTLPEFIAMCRPPFDYESAYNEAIVQMRRRRESGTDSWSDPAVFWAAASFGTDFYTSTYEKMAERWRVAVDRARLMENPIVPKAMVQPKIEAPRADARVVKAVKERADAMRMKQDGPLIDHWWKVLDAIRLGRTLPQISIDYATEVLTRLYGEEEVTYYLKQGERMPKQAGQPA